MDDGLSDEMREQLPLMVAERREIERLRAENAELRRQASCTHPEWANMAVTGAYTDAIWRCKTCGYEPESDGQSND